MRIDVNSKRVFTRSIFSLEGVGTFIFFNKSNNFVTICTVLMFASSYASKNLLTDVTDKHK
jgi:hypothetical protein